jgi:hypothetical protein
VLGITKREFHEVIIDLVKQKRQMADETNPLGSNAISTRRSNGEDVPNSHFSRPHWAQAPIETPVWIGHIKDLVMALIDHGSEINLMSREFYRKGRWPINIDHGWKIRAATKATEDLFVVCPDVPVKIGDIEIDQHSISKKMQLMRLF